MDQELSKKAGLGVVWNLINQFSQQAIQFVVVIVLARLLSPEDFGVFGMAVIFSTFFQSLRQWGYQAFLIQKKEIDDEYKDTAFWAICVLSLLIFLFCFFIATLVGGFFHNPAVGSVLRVLALTALLSPFGAVQWALVTRDLNFKVLSIRNVIASLVYGVAACILAWKGFGVWSLVIASLVREFVWSILFWVMYDWRPRFRCSVKKLREMTSFGIGCVGSGTLNYLINNIDGVFVGKFLGPNNLGQYNLAMNLVSQPQNKLVTHVASVAFPMFSQLQERKDKMREYYLKIIKAIMVVATPLLAILFASSYEFIVTVYGQKWEPAIFPVQIMCIYGLIKAISSMAEPVFLGLGRAGSLLKINFLRVIIFVVCIYFGVHYGLVGVSWAALIYSVFAAVPLFFGAHAHMQLSQRLFVKVGLKYIAIFFITAFSIILLKRNLLFPPTKQLIVNIVFGLGEYFIILLVISKQDLWSVVKMLKKSVV